MILPLAGAFRAFVRLELRRTIYLLLYLAAVRDPRDRSSRGFRCKPRLKPSPQVSPPSGEFADLRVARAISASC